MIPPKVIQEWDIGRLIEIDQKNGQPDFPSWPFFSLMCGAIPDSNAPPNQNAPKSSRRFAIIYFFVIIPAMGTFIDHSTTVISTTSTFRLMSLPLTDQAFQRMSYSLTPFHLRCFKPTTKPLQKNSPPDFRMARFCV